MLKKIKSVLVLLVAFTAHASSAFTDSYPAPPNYGSCYRDLCVGTRVYNIQRSYREAEIVGIESRGTYVLRFLDNGGVGGNWTDADLVRQ